MIYDHKQFCPTVAPEGWRYGGFDGGFYLFISGDSQSGFKELRALDVDLDAKNLAFMARHGLTR